MSSDLGHTAYHHVGDANDGLGHTAYHHVGDTSSASRVAGHALVAAAAFHGYRRNRSVAWAVWWAFCAWGLSPLITAGVAVAQGFGKPKRK